MIDLIKEQIKALHERMIEWRRHLHAHPELSFQEHSTAAFVAEILKAEGIEIRTDVGKLNAGAKGTGVIGFVKGEASSSDRCFAMRADLDALPITEISDRNFRSKNEGVMHACGHDAHTAMVLAAGIALHQLREHWAGTVMLVFQPGEEKEPGGATLLLKEKVFEDPRPLGILGQHVTPELEVGKVGFRSGPFMASADEIYIRVIGKGGHAAMPKNNIDPIPIAAQLILELHKTVKDRTPANEPTVFSIGKVIANGATNIVPDQVSVEGTLRTFNEEWRMELHRLIDKTAREVINGSGVKLEIEIRKGSPPLVNDRQLTENIRQHAIEFLGKENVIEVDQRMGAEDFAWYSQVMPACFYRLGTGNRSDPNTTTGLHRSEFDIDESALEIGAGLMAWAAVRELGSIE